MLDGAGNVNDEQLDESTSTSVAAIRGDRTLPHVEFNNCSLCTKCFRDLFGSCERLWLGCCHEQARCCRDVRKGRQISDTFQPTRETTRG